MFTESPDTSDSDYGSREFSAFSSPLSSSVPSSSNQNLYGPKRNVERKRQRYYGIPPVTPVDFVDFSKKDGYHPKTFVKPSHAVNENMKLIADLRQQKPEDFKNLDDHIKGYHHENVQTKTMFECKKKALEILKGILPIYDREQRFHICGSTMTGLGTNDSDMDICWVIPVFSNKCSKPTYPTSETNGFDPFIILMKAHKLIEKLLRHTKYPFVNIRRARVSILRFTMLVDDQKIRVDININNIAGIYNTFMLAHYAKIDKRFSMLAMVIKAWGLQAEIIDPVNGYLNTYTVYMMILHFLQCGVSPPIIPNLVGLRFDLFNGTLDLHKVAESFDFDLGITPGQMVRHCATVAQWIAHGAGKIAGWRKKMEKKEKKRRKKEEKKRKKEEKREKRKEEGKRKGRLSQNCEQNCPVTKPGDTFFHTTRFFDKWRSHHFQQMTLEMAVIYTYRKLMSYCICIKTFVVLQL